MVLSIACTFCEGVIMAVGMMVLRYCGRHSRRILPSSVLLSQNTSGSLRLNPGEEISLDLEGEISFL